MSKPGIYVVGDSCVREVGFVVRRWLIGGASVWLGDMERWWDDRTRACLFTSRTDAHRAAREQRAKWGYEADRIRVVRLMARVPG